MVYQNPSSNNNQSYIDPRKYEILEKKKIVMPSPKPNHARIIRNIIRIFDAFLRGKQCEVFSEMDIFMTEDDTVQPDVSVICDPEMLDNIKKKKKAIGVPHLIVEVLSPGTANRDRGYKMKLYAACGVKEYWLISPEELSISVYLSKDGVYELDNIYQIYPEYELEDMTEEEKAEIIMEFKTKIFDGLVISVEDVFEKVDSRG